MKSPSFALPELKIPDLPKAVMISISVMAVSLVLFVILFFTLGAARDQALDDVDQLTSQLTAAKRDFSRARTDREFVEANVSKFEALMASDKLIPHTRRAAIRELQEVALEKGLTSLDYNFQAVNASTPQAASTQPKAESYNVSVETISLTVDAPLDRPVYQFIESLHSKFPGALVLTSVEVARAKTISPEALNRVSLGQESGLVASKLVYSWRTAQQNKETAKGQAK
jgi:cell division protein FtsB